MHWLQRLWVWSQWPHCPSHGTLLRTAMETPLQRPTICWMNPTTTLRSSSAIPNSIFASKLSPPNAAELLWRTSLSILRSTSSIWSQCLCSTEIVSKVTKKDGHGKLCRYPLPHIAKHVEINEGIQQSWLHNGWVKRAGKVWRECSSIVSMQ